MNHDIYILFVGVDQQRAGAPGASSCLWRCQGSGGFIKSSFNYKLKSFLATQTSSWKNKVTKDVHDFQYISNMKAVLGLLGQRILWASTLFDGFMK